METCGGADTESPPAAVKGPPPPKMNHGKIAIYARTSTSSQADSIQNQLEICLGLNRVNHANESISEHDIFQDINSLESTLVDTGLERLLHGVSAGKYKIIIAKDFDRLFRSSKTQAFQDIFMKIFGILKKHRVTVITSGKTIKFTPDFDTKELVDLLDGVQNKKILKRKTQCGIIQKALSNKIEISWETYGYSLSSTDTYNSITRKYKDEKSRVLHPLEARVVLDIFNVACSLPTQYLTPYLDVVVTVQGIKQWLNSQLQKTCRKDYCRRRRTPPCSTWNNSHVRSILKNKSYYGCAIFKYKANRSTKYVHDGSRNISHALSTPLFQGF